jgi:hypothetical protein
MTPRLYLYLGVLLAGLGLAWYVQHLRGTVEDLTSEKVRLEVLVQTQNEAVQDLKDQADLKAAATKEALDLAARETAKAKSRAQDLYRAKPVTSDTCKSALDLLNQQSAHGIQH